MDTLNATLTTMQIQVHRKSDNFTQNLKTTNKNTVFREKVSNLKENFWTKIWKTLLKILKAFLWTSKCSFDKVPGFFGQRAEHFLLKYRKYRKNMQQLKTINFFQKILFWTPKAKQKKWNIFSHQIFFPSKSSSGQLESSLKALLRNRKKNISRECLSNSLSTSWVQFWKELRVILTSCQKSKNFLSKYETGETIFFHKTFTWTQKKRFWKIFWKTFAEGPKRIDSSLNS